MLIGDPAQLGEIEAGGLFAAIAARSEPVVLDEVIRHRHELDREGAKLIREGEGAEPSPSTRQTSGSPSSRTASGCARRWSPTGSRATARARTR